PQTHAPTEPRGNRYRASSAESRTPLNRLVTLDAEPTIGGTGGRAGGDSTALGFGAIASSGALVCMAPEPSPSPA
ncbi:hypothetical protein, partial [Aquidulcibacter sp.]|uniref:hypothetical protein n=1 Tax=Aquidulcibacter sp. TaxID=2052990 RepID=UPI0028B047B8